MERHLFLAHTLHPYTAHTFSSCTLMSHTLCLQPAAPLLACMMGHVSLTVLTLTTVPVWLATQAKGVKTVSL